MAARSHRAAERGRAGSGDEGLREGPRTRGRAAGPRHLPRRGKGRRRGAAIPRRKGSKPKLKALSAPPHGRAAPPRSAPRTEGLPARRGASPRPARLGSARRCPRSARRAACGQQRPNSRRSPRRTARYITASDLFAPPLALLGNSSSAAARNALPAPSRYYRYRYYSGR